METLGFREWLVASGEMLENDIQFLPLLLSSDAHSGDCTSENISCSLCILQDLLDDYYGYCKSTGHIK